MTRYRKRDLPVHLARRYLEPGPIVLLSTAWKGERDVMTMGWHMIMETEPSLFGCYIWDQNHSELLARRSKQCVINLPTADMVDAVVGIGNTSGTELDKFDTFGLTARAGTAVDAPVIDECYANFECKLVDGRQIKKYRLFIWEIVKARVATSPKRPQTLHYRGDGEFMVSGRAISRRRLFKPDRL